MDLLVKKRGHVRSSVTRHCNETEDALRTNLTIEQVHARMAATEGYRKELTDHDEQIQNKLSQLPAATERMDDELEKAHEYMEKLSMTRNLLSGRLKTLESAAAAMNAPTNTSTQNAPTGGNPPQSRKNHLPKQQLSTFDGNPLKWAEFWDDFNDSVHINTDISEVQKFKYLKQCLKSESLSMVDGFTLTSANYHEVIKLLKERYGDPQIAIFSHFEALLAIPEASHETDRLRAVYNQAESQIRSLVALGLEEDKFGLAFIPILLSKMPRYVRMEAHRKNGSTKWEFASLRKILKEEIEARERAEQQFMTHKVESNANENKPKGKSSSGKACPPSAAALVASDGKKEKSCVFCQGSHFSDRCDRCKDLEARQRFVQANQLCFMCLGSGHRGSECDIKYKCWYCKKCTHNRALCKRRFGKRETVSVAQEAEEEDTGGEYGSSNDFSNVNTITAVSLASPQAGGFRTVMQSAVAPICGPKRQVEARMVFDTAANRSFITKAKAEQIGAKVVRHDWVSLGRFRENRRSSMKYPIVELEVLNYRGERRRLQLAVVVDITTPIQMLPINDDVRSKLHGRQLAEEPVTETVSVTVDLLIGLDWYFELLDPACLLRFPQGLVFMASFFGYVAGERVAQSANSTSCVESNMLIVESKRLDETNVMLVQSEKSENFELEKFWSLEELGVKDSPTSKEDEVALRKFQESLQFVDNRFYVRWPFKDGMVDLPSNYGLALGRLRSLIRRHQHNPAVVEHYEQTFRDQLAAGIIEVAPKKPTGLVHYIPHQCVIKATSHTTKFRVVLDASAKSSRQGLSINDTFYHCPLILSDLVGVIIRFRRWKIAVMGDIEKAYLQIGLQETERDCTRFLWVKDASKPIDQGNVIIYRFKRVPFGFGPSAFLLSGSVDHLLLQENTDVALEIRDNKFVDNAFGGRQTVSEAISFVSEAIRIFQKASMNLREWYSNEQAALSNLSDEQRGSGTVTKVLGLKWATDKDELSCHVGFTSQTVVRTKRQLLKAMATVYDPCGFFTPITVHAKMVFQQLWLRNLGWDDEIPLEVRNLWVKCSANLLEIPSIGIRRQFQLSLFEVDNRVELHCFGDASAKAYAAVVYVRIVSKQGNFSNLVMSKSRVSPVKKPLGIPKLELMAALVGSRLVRFIEQEIRVPIARKFLWSDSKVTLHWIRGKQKYGVFVENRVKEIRGVEELNFRYVPTDQNPADLPSRGMSADELNQSALWWHGPRFLSEQDDRWPCQDIPDRLEIDEEPDIIDASSASDEIAMAVQANEIFGEKVPDFIDISRFSSLGKLYRVTAYALRFTQRRPLDSRTVTAEELDRAQWYWIKQVQSGCWRELMTSKLAKFTNERVQLGLFIDDKGVVRCRGRLGNSDLPYEARNPILLPKASHFTHLVIQDCHEKVFHAGPQHTLGELRTRFWVPHGRSTVQWVLKDCRICRKHQGGPYRVPEPPPLPDFRVKQSRPFSHVGLDYLGPVFVKEQGGEPKKVWVCLFTCAAVRAVHLEVVGSLSTGDFLQCLRRFMALYGVPDVIVSDNAKQFQAASRTVQRMWSDVRKNPAVRDFVAAKGTEWRFITQLAPWFGGFYERLVSPVKRALKRSLDKACVNQMELQTTVYEIARIVNSRPLIEVDSEVGSQTLTPAQFLFRDSSYVPTGKGLARNDITAAKVVSEWKKAQKLLDAFWETWRKQYLSRIRARFWSHHQRDTAEAKPKVGAVVQIADKIPRAMWRLGRITDLIVGSDGKIRSATVKLHNGNSVKRSIKHLHPLEMGDDPKKSKKHVAAIPGVLDSEAETSDEE